MCTYAFLVLHDVEKAKADTQHKVRVVGQQFEWTFYYRGANGREIKSAQPQLVVEINQPVEFDLQSKDVLHDFWVPSFRIKRDIVPGITTTYTVTPTKLGTYPIVCAELCGLGHATMRGTANVVTHARYLAYIANIQKGPAKPPPAPPTTDAKQLFTSSGCAACHTLKAAGATGTVGPDLDKVLKGQTPDFIKTSIVDPNAQIAPGFQPDIMPKNFGTTLSAGQINALVTYLSDVTKGG